MDITINLSVDGLLDAAERLAAIADRLQPACDEAVQEVADHAAMVARSEAPMDTGMLQNLITTQQVADGVDVVAQAPYASFVEFGTGLGSPAANAKTREAMADAGWVINLKGKGESGWQFPRSDGSGWATTHGQSGKGFMGQGAEAARSIAAETFASHIEGAMRK